MKKVKTRETIRNIKSLDKVEVLSQRVRHSFVRSKEHIDDTINNDNSSSANEYAQNIINSTGQTLSQGVAHIASSGNKLMLQSRVVEGGAVNCDASVNYRAATYKYTAYSRGQDLAKSQFKKDCATARDIKLHNTQQSIKSAHMQERSYRTSSKHKRNIKTSENTSKTKVKTSTAAGKTRKVANSPKNFAKTNSKKSKTKKDAIEAVVKSIVSGVRSLYGAIAAGGWVAIVIVVFICILGLLFSSSFGIFFSGDASKDEILICDVVRSVNEEYDTKINEIKAGNMYDKFEMHGIRTPWKEVLAIYAVNTSSGSSPAEVVTVDEQKMQQLIDTFWEMNAISHHIETELIRKAVLVETDDGELVKRIEEVEENTLIINIRGKTASQMADGLNFNLRQREQLQMLLNDEFSQMWTFVIYGLHNSDSAIVSVALSQLGNTGGQPYWSWYGFTSRVEWCACFVSWCANECGYIDTGIIPKFAWCPHGAQWFKDQCQWMDNSAIPTPGMIIFFDWDKSSTKGPDGVTDHVAIVERVEDGYVYTIEGNSGDCCRQQKYPIGHYEIYGYGVPEY